MTTNTIKLLDSLGGFSEVQYLQFLASQMSSTLRGDLEDDGAPDLSLNTSISVEDLLEPLRSYRFPEQEHYSLMSILGYILIGYHVDATNDDIVPDSPFKRLYVASLYLYCHTELDAADEEGEGGPWAIAELMEVNRLLDVEAQMHVVKFLLSLVVEYGENYRQSDFPSLAPRTSLLVGCTIVWADMLDSFRLLLSEMSEQETIQGAWGSGEIAHGESARLEHKITQLTSERGPTALINFEIDRILQILLEPKRDN